MRKNHQFASATSAHVTPPQTAIAISYKQLIISLAKRAIFADWQMSEKRGGIMTMLQFFVCFVLISKTCISYVS